MAARRPEHGQDTDALLGSGRTGFIFLGPEQLAREDVRASLTRAPVRLVAVDDAEPVVPARWNPSGGYGSSARAATATPIARAVLVAQVTPG
jgi:hypothetical protein